MAFGLGFDLPDQIIITAVLERGEQGPAFRSVIGKKDGCGQMLRIGIDGVAEQNKLKQRNPDHHSKRQAIATHLDEFLREHGAEPRDRKSVPLFMMKNSHAVDS